MGKKEKHMQQYQCTSCGYIYDPRIGDEEHGVVAGTPFEELPDEWVCPECGADKELFKALDD